MLQNTGKLAGCTLFITGASRGIGKAIALKAAKDGAKIVIAAKTAEPHPKLAGTIFTAAKEIEEAGGQALPCVVDVRNEKSVGDAIEQATKVFGGIDILVNNASAISLTGTLSTPMKTYDLMNQINARGTYLCSKMCIEQLSKSKNGHILNISPPLNMDPRWFTNHVAYTMAKYGMSMCVLGMSGELKKRGIAVNALWPRTAIITAAMEMIGGKNIASKCRKPEIMADAAYAMLCRDAKSFTGNFAVDDAILKEEGITNFDSYAVQPGGDFIPDFFLDELDEAMQDKAIESGAAQNQSVESGGKMVEIQNIFSSITPLISEEIVSKTKAIYAFEVTGDDQSTWHLNLKEGSGSCGQGGHDNPDVTFTLNSENMVKLFKGGLKPTAAFMAGKLKISGDVTKAMKLEKLMGSLQSKL